MPNVYDKIDWVPPGTNLAEIYQEVETKFSFAFISKEGILTQSHPWVKCRDFLHDAVAGELYDYDVRIFGFTFNKAKYPKRNRVCTDRTVLMISKKGIKNPKEFEVKLRCAMDYINHYEKLLGLNTSVLSALPDNTVHTDYKHVWLFEGPKFWISAPHLISLLTFLIRLGEKLPAFKMAVDPSTVFKNIALDPKYPEGTTDNDIKYLRKCYDKIEAVLLLTSKIEEMVGTDNGFLNMYSWQKGKYVTDQSMFHDRSGIFSACTASLWVTKVNKLLSTAFNKK